MKADTVHKLLEELEEHHGKAFNPASLEVVWDDMVKVPEGAYAESRRRLKADYQRLPSAESVRKVLIEEGIKCSRNSARLHLATMGKVVKSKFRSEAMSEEEMDEYVRRSGEVARCLGDPERQRVLIEAMIQDYPGNGWEEAL